MHRKLKVVLFIALFALAGFAILLLNPKNEIYQHSQVSEDQLEKVNDTVVPLATDTKSEEGYLEYEGVYHFGISEAESDIVIRYHENKYEASRESIEVIEGNLIPKVEELKNVQIKDNLFLSDTITGEFIFDSVDKNKVTGLKVFPPISEAFEDEEGNIIGMNDSPYEVGYKEEL